MHAVHFTFGTRFTLPSPFAWFTLPSVLPCPGSHEATHECAHADSDGVFGARSCPKAINVSSRFLLVVL